FGGQAENQGGSDEAFEYRVSSVECGGSGTLGGCSLEAHSSTLGLPRGKPRAVDDHIYFLRAFDLKNLRDRMAAFGRCFPMNLVKAVAGAIFAQFFEIPTLADLPLNVEAKQTTVEKQRGQILSFGQ